MKKIKFILKLVVSFSLIAFILVNVDKTSLMSTLRDMDMRFAALSITLIFLNYVFSSIRWKRLLIHQDTQHITVAYLTRLYLVGAFFNNFMPTNVGGDVYKMYKLGKKLGNTSAGISSTFMERFTGILILVLISLISLFQLLGYMIIFLVIWFVLAVILVMWALKFLAKRFKGVDSLYQSLLVYKNEKYVLVYAFVTSIFVQLFSIFAQYFIFSALGFNLPVLYSLFVFPVITLAGFFIPSLNGVGVQDLMYMNLFIFVGISPEVGFSASLMYHLFRLLLSLVGGVLYAFGKAD